MKFYRFKVFSIIPSNIDIKWPDFSQTGYPRIGEWIEGKFPNGDAITLEVQHITHKEEIKGDDFTHVIEIEVR